MDKKVLFNETLASLVEFAAVNNNKITMNDVKTYFKNLIDDESQYQFIYDYLAVNKIKIEGYAPSMDADNETLSDNNVFETFDATESEEELAFIDMYMSEISDILPASDEDVSTLVSQILSGELSAVNRLVECHLSTVAEMAKNYRGRGVTFGDLIQEGNIGLMLAISEYSENCGDFNVYIKKRVSDTLEDVICSQTNADRISRHLADKLNQLDTVTRDLSEKLGRVPDISELAKAMNITEDDASFLLKTSLDTLSVNEDTQITPENDAQSPQNNASQADPLEWRINKK